MVGQKNLTEKLDSFNLDNFPHTVLLNGIKGCGKHLYARLVSEKLGVELVDITKSINLDLINDIILSNTVAIYLIDTDDVTERVENSILKFIEEPLKSYYVILISSNKDSLLPTIRNRCRVFDFLVYDKKVLEEFVPSSFLDRDIVLEIAKTPGQVLELTSDNSLNQMFQLAEKLIEKYSVASYGNILNISDSINFKNDKGKFDCDCFYSILIYLLSKRISENESTEYQRIYKLTNDLIKKSSLSNLNRQYLFEEYLFQLKDRG